MVMYASTTVPVRMASSSTAVICSALICPGRLIAITPLKYTLIFAPSVICASCSAVA